MKILERSLQLLRGTSEITEDINGLITYNPGQGRMNDTGDEDKDEEIDVRCLIGEGDNAIDLMQCVFVLKGITRSETEAIERQISGTGIGFVAKQKELHVHVSFLLHQNMSLVTVLVVDRDSRVVFDFPFTSAIEEYESGDRLNLNLVLSVDRPIRIERII